MSKKAYHHGNLRDALIGAAQNILATSGVEGLSLRKVAQHAGVSATAPYGHFKDKRELLAVLATQGFEGLLESMAQEAATLTGKTGYSLTGLARGYIKFSTQNTALFQLMFGTEIGELEDFPTLAAAGSKCYSMMADSVATQIQATGSPSDTSVAATAAWSLVHGLSTLINDGRVSADSCGVNSNEEMVERVCRMLSFSQTT